MTKTQLRAVVFYRTHTGNAWRSTTTVTAVKIGHDGSRETAQGEPTAIARWLESAGYVPFGALIVTQASDRPAVVWCSGETPGALANALNAVEIKPATCCYNYHDSTITTTRTREGIQRSRARAGQTLADLAFTELPSWELARQG